MHLTIPVDTIKLILLTAFLWSVASIFSVVALCSIGYISDFYVIVRPTWTFLIVLAAIWCCSPAVGSYRMFGRATFYTPLK